MATVTKDFRVKNGLIVEGTSGTINGNNILTTANDTDDLGEGSNLYFTDARAKSSAANLLTNATLTNITISGDGDGLVITAENGVADSDTDDLTEGSTNLYFTNARAISAIEGASSLTLTGGLTLSGNPTTSLQAATKQYVDNAVSTGVGDIDSDDVPEGSTNLYYTTSRAQSDAASLLTGANLTNIQITGDGNGLTITAENGVSDSTTDDLTEGSSNLYFTDARAQAAVAQDITDAVDAIDTDVIEEGSTNLYFTDARAQAAVAQDIQDAVNALDTDDIEEGSTNLYFTDQRALDATASAYDAAGSADAAQAAAEGYADGLATNYEAAGSVSTHSDLTTGVHGVSGDVVGTSDSQTLSNKTMGDDLLMDGNQVSGLGTPTQADHAATKGYVDTAVAGLNWKDSVNLLADANVDISGDLVGLVIDGHDALDITDVDYRILLTAQSTDSENGIYELYESSGELLARRPADADSFTELVDASVMVKEGTTYGTSSWVQSNHYLTDFTGQDWVQFAGSGLYSAGNGLVINGNEFAIDTTITATRTFVTDSIDAIDTDAIEEGSTNLYFTDARAQAAVAQDITDAIDAIDTDDIEEGSSNLYFTDQRAVDALEAVVPNFTEVDINSVATQVAATINLSDTNQTAAYSFDSGSYRSAKFVVKAAYGTHTEVSEILVTLDTSDNIAITEYAIVSTNGNLVDVTAGINGTDVEILATAGTANTDVTVVGTLIA